jgi:hypothetical protein
MIKIPALKIDIGEKVIAWGRPAIIAGYVNYNTQFFYIIVYDGDDKGEECPYQYVEKAA